MPATQATPNRVSTLQAAEALLDRKGMLILYAGYYLALVGVIMRGLDYYFLQDEMLPNGVTFHPAGYDQRWLVAGLLAVYSAITVSRHWLPRRPLVSHVYLVVQSAIAFSLLIVEPGQDYFAILFFLLSLQAMQILPLLTGYAWIGVFGVLTTLALLGENNFVEGLALSLLYIAGFYFFGSFAAATAQAQRARHEVQTAYGELSQREAALSESEARYRRLVEESPDAIVVFDRQGRFVDVNVSACAKLGYSREEFLTRGLRDIYPGFDGSHLPLVEEHFDSQPDEGHFRLEDLELVGRDGISVPVEAHLAAIEIDGERHFLAIVRDVTERKQSEAALLAQTRELAVLDERNRFAREMHDTLAQGFTGIVLQLEAAEQAIGDDPAAAATHLSTAKSLARDSLQEARRSVWDLRPSALGDGSLEDALRAEVARLAVQGTHATFTAKGERSLVSENVETGLLRVCQEALTNVRRHARATRVDVGLLYGDGCIHLTVQDDGAGFDPSAVAMRGGLGLRGMQERVALLGGVLDVRSRPGAGTTIEARVATALTISPSPKSERGQGGEA